jgi:hypothetical protein
MEHGGQTNTEKMDAFKNQVIEFDKNMFKNTLTIQCCRQNKFLKS